MTIGQALLFNLAASIVAVLVLWIASLLRRDVSIVDIWWGLGFALITWLSLGLTDLRTIWSFFLALLVTLWGVRLAGYLAWRNHGQPEDYRYAAMRTRHGKRFALVSLFTVFGLQGVLMWVISLPLQMGILMGRSWSTWGIIGLVLWLVGMFFETVGDYQLARFKAVATNQGRVLNQGLWRYTRHPNYFGEFLIWWGFYLMSAERGSWWWTWIGPLVISFLLIRVSGVRLLETALQHRLPEYERYLKSTSPFLPLPPRRPPSDPSQLP